MNILNVNKEEKQVLKVLKGNKKFKMEISKYGDLVLICPSISFDSRDDIYSIVSLFSSMAMNYASENFLSRFKVGIRNENKFEIVSKLNRNRHSTFYAFDYNKLAKKINNYMDLFFGYIEDNYSEMDLTNMTFCLICYDTNMIKSKNKNKGGSFIELPYYIKKSQSIINIKNNDNKCFLWSILAHLYPSCSNPNRVSKYKKYEKTLETRRIKWPISFDQFDMFSQDNSINFCIYEIIVSDDEKETNKKSRLVQIYNQTDDFIKNEPTINLLLYKGHFMYIKNLSGLVKCLLQTKRSVYVCYNCGESYYYTINAYEKHLLNCPYLDSELIYKLDESNEKIYFKNNYKSHRVPNCVYADFESILEPIDNTLDDSKDIKVDANSKKLTRHIPCAVGIAFWDNEILQETYHLAKTGQECIDLFLDTLENIGKKMAHRFNYYKGLELKKMVGCAEKQGEKDNVCCICKKTGAKFITESTINSSMVVGVCHEFCRMSYFKQIKSIPVLFHNLKNYDAHLFIDSLAKRFKNLSCIPITKEKYISFKACFWVEQVQIEFRFLDTIGFLGGSLASNVSTLSSFNFINKVKSNLEWKNLHLLDNKLPFPYEYIKSFDVLNEDSLPLDDKDWFSTLKNACPCKNEIILAHKTFKEWNCKSIGDYMLLYLRMDVILLMEVFEKFRYLAMEEYHLDPLHYYTTPGFAWDAALKYTNVKLDVLNTDELVGFFIHKGVIRGGISTVSELKYAKSDCIDSNIMYYDVTNLYGYAMTKSLPTGNFKIQSFKCDDSITSITQALEILQNYSDDDITGYMFEVDIEYPIDLLPLHNALPFLVERINGKLIPILRDKYNYRLHICILKQAIKAGLLLKRIHKIVSFDQSKWLKDYIMHNTNERAKTKDPNKRNFYKLMNNSVYGKTMENILNRSKFNIYDTSTFNLKMKRVDFRNKVKSITQLTPNIIISEESGMIPVYNKPIYIGFSILEISKHHMYTLLYDVIKVKFKTSKLMYMDTDSLILYINERVNYVGIEDWFDLNSKGVLGTLKDEYPHSPITKFLCLKSKCYILETLNGYKIVKNKGVTSNEGLDFKDFEEMLDAEIRKDYVFKKTNQINFRSINHQIYTISTDKISLTSLDDKRFPPLTDYSTLCLNEK